MNKNFINKSYMYKFSCTISPYIKTAEMTARNQTNGGIIYLLPNYMIRLVYLLPLIILWRTLMNSGVETGMTLSQMLTYTFISNLFGDLLNITSPLTHWIMDSPLLSACQRPMTIYGNVMAESIGKTIPGLLLFSLPMLLLAPFLEINAAPISLWFIPSLVLCISLGFAVEFIFGALLVYMINTSWIIHSIRNAVIWLFSGAVLPFSLLPFGLDKIMKYQPLGSLAGAPLSIYTGIETPIKVIIIQVIWNLILWPISIAIFNKSRERMVSNGG